MTKERAIELIKKLSESMSYNDRLGGNEYASGLSGVYSRAYILLRSDIMNPDPLFNSGMTGEGEPLVEVAQQIEDEAHGSSDYIIPYLQRKILGKKIDYKDIVWQVQYYLGRMAASRAVVKILEQVDGVKEERKTFKRKRFYCNVCKHEVENHGTEVKPNWWHKYIQVSSECHTLWSEKFGDTPYAIEGIEFTG